MKAGLKQTGKTDVVLVALVLILVVFGLAALFSASEYNGRVRFHDSAYYFKKQLFAYYLERSSSSLIKDIIIRNDLKNSHSDSINLPSSREHFKPNA